jgi:hypothetical protein
MRSRRMGRKGRTTGEVVGEKGREGEEGEGI